MDGEVDVWGLLTGKCIHFMKFVADVEDMKYPFEDIL